MFDRTDEHYAVVFHRSLKVEYDKLANEKTEMQRHYVMVRTHRDRERERLPQHSCASAGCFNGLRGGYCQVRACESPQGPGDAEEPLLTGRLQWAQAPLNTAPLISRCPAAAAPSECADLIILLGDAAHTHTRMHGRELGVSLSSKWEGRANKMEDLGPAPVYSAPSLSV